MQSIHIPLTNRMEYNKIIKRYIAAQDLQTHFAGFGNLISARIMTDKITGRSKGYGIKYNFQNI